MKPELFDLHAEMEEHHWWFTARRRIVQRLVASVLPPSPSATVVDVGCGTGANIAALSRQYRCVGVDTSERAIRLARQRYPDVTFLQGLAPQVLGAQVADVRLFLLMDVLEHVADDFALLSSLVAASQPGTLFLVTVPADMRLWSEHDVSFGHFRRYTRERFAQTWEHLPVGVRLLSHFNSRLYPLVRAARTLGRVRGRPVGDAGTDLRLPPPPVNRALETVFAGEGRALERALRTGRSPYRFGVSLMALLQRVPDGNATRQGVDNAAAPAGEPESAFAPAGERGRA